MKVTATLAAVLLSTLLLQACDGNNNNSSNPAPEPESQLLAGAASRSMLPTVNGGRDYLVDAPGWPVQDQLDPDDPGVFIESWDQGEVDVGNGRPDSAWVHDDLWAAAQRLFGS